MKFTFLSLSTFLLSATLAKGGLVCEEYEPTRRGLRSLKSSADAVPVPDVAGSVKIDNGNCGLSCSWGANGIKEQIPNSKSGKEDIVTKNIESVDLDFVDCILAIGGKDIAYTVPYPGIGGWTEIEKTAGGADDFYSFTTPFEILVGDVAGVGTNCLTMGDITLEFTVSTTAATDLAEAFDTLVYAGSGIDVTC